MVPAPQEHDLVTEGGDPACWAHLVCPVCGRMREGREPHVCEGEETPWADSSRDDGTGVR